VKNGMQRRGSKHRRKLVLLLGKQQRRQNDSSCKRQEVLMKYMQDHCHRSPNLTCKTSWKHWGFPKMAQNRTCSRGSTSTSTPIQIKEMSPGLLVCSIAPAAKNVLLKRSQMRMSPLMMAAVLILQHAHITGFQILPYLLQCLCQHH
jgi:hypothetical protein